MAYLIALGGILAGWTLLRLLAAEREKQIRRLHWTLHAERAAAEEAARNAPRKKAA